MRDGEVCWNFSIQECLVPSQDEFTNTQQIEQVYEVSAATFLIQSFRL